MRNGYLRSLASLLLAIAATGTAGQIPPAGWRALEGADNAGRGSAHAGAAGITAAGAHAIPLAAPVSTAHQDIQLTARIRLPAASASWASASLALYGAAPHDERRYFMAMTGAPDARPGRIFIALWTRTKQLAIAPLDFPGPGWYRIHGSLSDGQLRMNCWPEGAAEPPGWAIAAEAAPRPDVITAWGVRTYGQPYDFADLRCTVARTAPTRLHSIVDPAGRWRARVDSGGRLREMVVLSRRRTVDVPLRRGQWAGPAWQIETPTGWQTVPMASVGPSARFAGAEGDLRFALRFEARAGRLAIVAAIRNAGRTPRTSLRAGLRLGLDTYMVAYPDWRSRCFPTLLRSERTHFWGYAMSPAGTILAIASPQPIASWRLDYQGEGHRINTLSLDLMDPGPLPTRHPRGLDRLAPGQTREWTILLEPIDSLQQAKPQLSRACAAPMIEADRWSVEPGRRVNVTVFSPAACAAAITGPMGTASRALPLHPAGAGVWRGVWPAPPAPGAYALRATASGRVAEAILTVRRPWSWYLQQARRQAITRPQKGGSHVEGWYGLFSCFAARVHFPDPTLDAAADARFREIWPLMYDLPRMAPIDPGRVQNHACAAGLMASRYRATHDLRDLEFAASLADFMLTTQSADGAYRNGRTHYTSVVYCAKSLIEVMAAEREMAERSPEWRARYQRQADSVRRAVDELAHSRDNIETEGEMTYEDGMIACSTAQLALEALREASPARRARLTAAAREMGEGHRCLEQRLAPDGRVNGASLRFWESQYDVLMTPNMMNSPHGWSAWTIYGLWYRYLLTGDESLLRAAQNALGACVQLIDARTGELRWAFVPDPRVAASVWEPDPTAPGRGRRTARTIGEEYRPMISGWYRAKPGKWVTGYWGDDGGSCDNDVHEVFKCLEEVALTSAYLVERADGSLDTWNCTARRSAGAIIITPAESVVSRIHLNLRRPARIAARFARGALRAAVGPGMRWLGPGGLPEILRTPAGMPAKEKPR